MPVEKAVDRPEPLRVVQIAFTSLAATVALALVALRALRHIKIRVYR